MRKIEKKEPILEWLKEELNQKRIQVVIPPTDEEITRAIKDLMKIPKMKDMFERALIISTKRREYMKTLAFFLECSVCDNNTTTHRFVEQKYEDSNNRVKCVTCGHIGYILYNHDFDDFYVKGIVSLSDLNFKKI